MQANFNPNESKGELCKEDGVEKIDETLYRCLMYLTTTRPYINHVVSLLSRYWAGCFDDMRSTSCYRFSYGSRVFFMVL